jgi:hypothetical protein
MKNNDKHQPMPWLQTLSECRREDRDLSAHSIGELDGWSKRNRINVQFAPLSEPAFEIKIRRAQKKPLPARPFDSVMLLAAAHAALTTLGEL